MAVAPYTGTGARLYIAPAVTAPPASASAYAALSWTEVKNVREISSFGELRPIISRAVVGRDRPVKKVGPADPGSFTITLYPDDGDAGQIALAAAASAPQNRYPLKIAYPAGSKISVGALVALRYFLASVVLNWVRLGAVDEPVTDQFKFELMGPIIRISSVIPPVMIGEASIMLGSLTVTASAIAPVRGTLSVTLGSLVSSDVSNELLVGGETLTVGGEVLTL